MKGNTSTFAIFKTKNEAEDAVVQLKIAGFRADDVSVLLPHGESSKDFAHEKGTKAPEGAAVGTTTGVLLGASFGWLVGIGSLAIPGVGPFIAAGPIMAALAGAGLGGTVGGLSGALLGLGIPEYKAKRYEGMIHEGGVLMSVHCDDSDWAKKAQEIFKNTGGSDIASTKETASKGDKKPERPSSQYGTKELPTENRI